MKATNWPVDYPLPSGDPYLPRGISEAGLLRAIEESNGIEWDAKTVEELRKKAEIGGSGAPVTVGMP